MVLCKWLCVIITYLLTFSFSLECYAYDCIPRTQGRFHVGSPFLTSTGLQWSPCVSVGINISLHQNQTWMKKGDVFPFFPSNLIPVNNEPEFSVGLFSPLEMILAVSASQRGPRLCHHALSTPRQPRGSEGPLSCSGGACRAQGCFLSKGTSAVTPARLAVTAPLLHKHSDRGLEQAVMQEAANALYKILESQISFIWLQFSVSVFALKGKGPVLCCSCLLNSILFHNMRVTPPLLIAVPPNSAPVPLVSHLLTLGSHCGVLRAADAVCRVVSLLGAARLVLV